MSDRATDPATGRRLPDGVQYLGPKQYRAGKLLHGKRITKTFDTARQAAGWLAMMVLVFRRRRETRFFAASTSLTGAVPRQAMGWVWPWLPRALICTARRSGSLTGRRAVYAWP
jgi:hypothetical protein